MDGGSAENSVCGVDPDVGGTLYHFLEELDPDKAMSVEPGVLLVTVGVGCFPDDLGDELRGFFGVGSVGQGVVPGLSIYKEGGEVQLQLCR